MRSRSGSRMAVGVVGEVAFSSVADSSAKRAANWPSEHTRRASGQDHAETVAERADLRPGRLRHLDRIGPSSIDVADDREGAAVWMRQQASWQRRHERLGGKRRRAAGLRQIHKKLVDVRRAATKAGEQHRDYAVHIGIVRHVGGGENALGLHAAVAWPVLAKSAPCVVLVRLA